MNAQNQTNRKLRKTCTIQSICSSMHALRTQTNPTTNHARHRQIQPIHTACNTRNLSIQHAEHAMEHERPIRFSEHAHATMHNHNTPIMKYAKNAQPNRFAEHAGLHGRSRPSPQKGPPSPRLLRGDSRDGRWRWRWFWEGRVLNGRRVCFVFFRWGWWWWWS